MPNCFKQEVCGTHQSDGVAPAIYTGGFRVGTSSPNVWSGPKFPRLRGSAQSRLGVGVMFSSWPSACPSVRPSVCYLSVLWTRYFENEWTKKWTNVYATWHKRSTVHRTKAWKLIVHAFATSQNNNKSYLICRMVPFPMTFSDPRPAVDVLYAQPQLTRDLFAIDKFLVLVISGEMTKHAYKQFLLRW